VAKKEIQLRYSDIDLLGHVSNTIYSEYLEIGRIEWFSRVPEKCPPSVVVNINIDFLGEINLQDQIHVVTYCSKVGTKSVQLTQEIYTTDRCVTKATVVMVGCDTKTRTSIPLLPDWEPSSPAND